MDITDYENLCNENNYLKEKLEIQQDCINTFYISKEKIRTKIEEIRKNNKLNKKIYSPNIVTLLINYLNQLLK